MMDPTEAMVYHTDRKQQIDLEKDDGQNFFLSIGANDNLVRNDSQNKRYLHTSITRILIILFTLGCSWYVMYTAYTILVPKFRFTANKNSEVWVCGNVYTDTDTDWYDDMLDPRNTDDPESQTENVDEYLVSDALDIKRTVIGPEPSVQKCSNVPKVLRFDCHPQDGATKSSCEARGCCWDALNDSQCEGNDCFKRVPLDIPYCFYPEDWPDYEYINSTRDGQEFTGFLKRKVNSFYKKDIPVIRMESTHLSNSILRVKIDDPNDPRYEPLYPDKSDWDFRGENVDADIKFLFQVDEEKPGFAIRRAEDNNVLFDSIGRGGFIFADQFLEIHALLSSNNIYGLGEHRSRLRLDTNWQSFTMFNRDQAPTEKTNLYGTHPFYLAIEDSGKCHGVLFLNSNAMDVILQPAPAITYRTIGGVFDIYFFLGPTPADVLRQYSEIVGKPFMPPYWSLGFHLCKYRYGSLAKTQEVWNRTRNAEIPFDVQWNDIDYMDRNNDFTYDTEKFKDLPSFVDEIHSVGMHYIPLIDAGVSASEKAGSYPPYDEGLRDGVFIKEGGTDKPFVGKVWNYGLTAWPDFTNPNATEYFHRMLQKTHDMFKFDGIWLDMNEPSNFYDGLVNGCPKNDLDNPQYVPNVQGVILASKTVCMNAKHHLGPHYNFHNTHAVDQAIVVNSALKKIRNKRPFIISRGSWEGLGHYAGHWSGDVFSRWHDLESSIAEILSYSLFQVPMTGADICGFNGNTTQALCNRWTQLGAFYPFSRNHNSDDTIEQDPVIMGELVVKSARKALMIRYRFIPYLYTLFFKAHRFGDTVARPLFFEFINDKNTYDIDKQFLWGSSLMIIPVLEENSVQVSAYLPRGLWYDFYSKSFTFSTGGYKTLDAPLDTIPLMVRGGSILPAQTPNVTTTSSRKNKFELLVALDHDGSATGEMYWDDGDSLDSLDKKEYRWMEFTVKNQTLTNRDIEEGNFGEDMILGKVSVMGVEEKVNRVLLNGKAVPFIYEEERSYLNIKGLHVDLKTKFELSWK